MNDNATHIAALNEQDHLPAPDPGEPDVVVTRYELDSFGIVVTTWYDGRQTYGEITSDLNAGDYEDGGDGDIKVAFDTIESFVLAAACARVDIETPAFLEAIETTVDATLNWLG